MKKLFVNPEITSMELTPGESIMATGILKFSGETEVQHTVTDTAASIDAEYNMWKGFKN